MAALFKAKGEKCNVTLQGLNRGSDMRGWALTAATGVALVALAISDPAAAADVATKAPPQPTPQAPSNTWTGFYVGANGGYGWKDPTVTFTPNDVTANNATCASLTGGTCAPPASFGISGGLGGVEAGYNWQANQSWLVGVETDFDWSRIRGAGTSNFLIDPLNFPPGTSSFSVNQNVDWFGTIRGRLGWMPVNSTLLFGTVGFAYGHVNENVALNSTPNNNLGNGTFSFQCSAAGNCFSGASSRIATGWTAGGGIEHALWRNVSVKAEFLYVSLGGDTVRVTALNTSVNGNTPSSFSAAFSRLDFYVARGGLNWRF